MKAIFPKIKLVLFRLFRDLYKKKLFREIENQLEFKFLAAFLDRYPFLFIDVGANRGEFIYLAEKKIPPARIVAFEPLPWFALKLKALFKGISVFSLALSDKNSETTLYLPLKNGIPDDSLASVNPPAGAGYRTYPVSLKRLDDLTQENKWNEPSFLKIDVEGHEFAVLKGGENFIRLHVQLMLIEIEERHHPGKDLATMLKEVESMGFACFYLHPQKKQLVRYAEYPEVHQKESDLNTPLYINNFWFFAKHLAAKDVVTTLNQAIS